MVDLLALVAGVAVGVLGAVALAKATGGRAPVRVAAPAAAPAPSPTAARGAEGQGHVIRVNRPGAPPPPAPAPAAAAAPPPRPAAPPAAEARPSGPVRARLVLSDGSDEVELGDEVITLGRGTEQRLRIPDSRVSRAHAIVRPRAKGGWEVKDVGSSNGTQLNGHTIPEGRVAPLRDGDRIGVGPMAITYHETSGQSPAPPAAPGPDPTTVL